MTHIKIEYTVNGITNITLLSSTRILYSIHNTVMGVLTVFYRNKKVDEFKNVVEVAIHYNKGSMVELGKVG